MADKRVIDTGVILAADGKQGDVGRAGMEACVRRLLLVCQEGGLVLDNGNRIFGEYLNRTRPWNPQTVGEQFVKWVHDHRMNPARCDRVDITPKAEDAEDFEEFPADERLNTFERADRKFVAVAHKHSGRPAITVAIDTDYYRPLHRAAFAAHGIKIDYLCEEDLRRVHERKYGQE